jgi:plastocyanin
MPRIVFGERRRRMRMRRARTTVVIGLAVAALAAAGCGGDDDESASGTTDTESTTETEEAGEANELYGTVGPGFTIKLTTEDGEDVTSVAAGTYTIEVDDQSDAHNFHLTGSGVDETTEVSGTGEVTWEVTFEPGEYTFVCDPHSSSMRGSVEVT